MRTRTFPGLGFDPTPGSVADVEAVLARLDQASSVVDGSAHGLRRSARAGSWRGAAASAFRSRASGMAGGLDDVVRALRSASRAVSSWQSRLAANQREAESLEALARSLRLDPEARDQLALVLDRAYRLQARHLRQADAVAVALRSGAAHLWPAESTARLSGRVTGWTGDVAVGLATPVRPPGTAPSGWSAPGLVSGRPVDVGWPGIPGRAGLGMDPPHGPILEPVFGPVPEGHRRPGLVGQPLGAGVPAEQGLSELPAVSDGTAPAGWLDTSTASLVRAPLDHPVRALPDPTTSLAHDLTSRPNQAVRPDIRLPVTDSETGRLPARAETVRDVVHARGDAARGAAQADPPRGRAEVHGRAETTARSTGRLGGHAALAGSGGPDGHGGPGVHRELGEQAGHDGPSGHSGPSGHAGSGRAAEFAGHQVATAGSPADSPPPQPAPVTPPAPPPSAPVAPPVPPVDQTVEQAAQSVDQRVPTPDHAHQGDQADRSRAPDPGRAAGPEPGRGTPFDAGRGVGLDAGRPTGLEQGRTVGADPAARPTPATPGQSTQSPAKGRDDTTVAAAMIGLPGEPAARVARPDRLLALLMTRLDSRPVLIFGEPGGGALFRTGLIPCASPLPGCATPLTTTASPDVY